MIRSRAPSRARGRAPATSLVAAGVVLLLAVFLAWPLVRVVMASVAGAAGVTAAAYAAIFRDWPLATVLLRTLLLAALAAPLTVALALVLAVLVVRTDATLRRFTSAAIVFPVLAPPFVGALVLLLLLGPGGIGRAWAPAWRGGLGALLAAQVFTFLPPAFLLVARLLAGVDAALDEVAEGLGASRLAAFARMTLAALRPGLATTALVVGALSLGDVANPLLVGGDYRVLGAEIYERAMSGRLESASAMAVVLALGSLVAWLAARPWARLPALLRGPLATGVPPRPLARPARWALGALGALAALAIVAAFALVLVASLAAGGDTDRRLVADHYVELVGPGGRALAASVGVALVAGVAGSLLALATAAASAARGLARRTVDALVLLALAAPGPLVGLGYLLAFGADAASPTPWRALACVVVWSLPLGAFAARVGLESVDRSALAVATSVGAGRRDLLVRIVAPLLRSTAGWIFVYFFASGMVTLNAVVFLGPAGGGLAAVAALEGAGRTPGAACALVVAITAISAAAIALLAAIRGWRASIVPD